MSKKWSLPALFTSPEEKARQEKKAHIANLVQTKEIVLSGANEMTEAHTKLTHTVDQIDQSIQAVENQDLTILKDALDNNYDFDEKYKEDLKKELDNTKAKTLKELEPLRETADKLRGNILVSQYKASSYAMVIRAKAEVIDSAQIQVDKLKELNGEGQEISEEINQLLKECEELNNVAASGNFGIKNATENPFDLVNSTFMGVKPTSNMKDVGPSASQ